MVHVSLSYWSQDLPGYNRNLFKVELISHWVSENLKDIVHVVGARHSWL